MGRKSNLASDILSGLIILLLSGIIIWTIVNQIRECMLKDDPMLHKLRDRLKDVHPVVKNLKLYKGSKSYTLNKDKIFMCLKDEKGDYYDENTLSYVLLHEISHKLCDEIGHTEKFHQIFGDLQKRAAELGVFDPNKPIVQDYCEY